MLWRLKQLMVITRDIAYSFVSKSFPLWISFTGCLDQFKVLISGGQILEGITLKPNALHMGDQLANLLMQSSWSTAICSFTFLILQQFH